MIGSSPIGSSPIGSYFGEGVPAAGEYSITASIALPTLAMQINIAYEIVASTVTPSMSMTASFQQFMDITTSTTTPSISMGMYSSRTYSVTASTSKPSIHITMQGEHLFSIAAETTTPSVAMTIIQNLAYVISASTNTPVILITMSGPVPAIVSGETTAWCVNMATGAHSRYTNYPDASATSTIAAYALTAVTDFGDTHEKYCHDIYIHCRLPDNGITIDTITDEWIERTGYEVEPCDNVQGLTRRRRKLAKGIKGQNWQFRLNNVSSGSFTVKSIEPAVVKSQRRV